MPDTSANQSRYPQSGEQKKGLGFPVARLVALISLTSGAVLGWALGACKGKSTREVTLLRSLMPHLKRGDVLIADRFYAGYFTIAHLAQSGGDVGMRQQARRKTDFRRGRQWAPGDHVVIWHRLKPADGMSAEFYLSLPETLSIREIRCGRWIIISTLTDARAVSKAELLRLYSSFTIN